MGDDPDLRQRFAHLRIEETRRMPSFTQILSRRRPAARADFRPLGMTACLLVAIVTGTAMWHSRDRAPARPSASAPSLADWRSPTDFLLQTDTLETWRTVPVIGAPLPGNLGEFPPFNDARPAHRAAREQS
jgi:hypothetical protein